MLLLSAAALVLANLVPLAGLLVLGWSPIAVLVLYWLESGAVGLYGIVRIVSASGEDRRNPLAGAAGRALQKLMLVPFFALHYGLFWVAHGLLVRLVAGAGDGAGLGVATGIQLLDDLSPGALGPGVLIDGVDEALTYALVALVVSHGVSLVLNWFLGGEYRRAAPSAETTAVYARVLVLQLVVLIAFVPVLLFDVEVPVVAVLVVGKTAVDLGLHVREHRRRPHAVPARHTGRHAGPTQESSSSEGSRWSPRSRRSNPTPSTGPVANSRSPADSDRDPRGR